MRNPRTMLALATLALSASGCATADRPRAVLAAPAQSGTAEDRRAAITRQLAPACPTPTRWSPAERRVVGTFVVLHAETPAMQLLAPEWERLNEGAKLCRGER